MSKGVRFTDEFKQDAVAQVVERGYSVSEVAERLGISTKSLYTLGLVVSCCCYRPVLKACSRMVDAIAHDNGPHLAGIAKRSVAAQAKAKGHDPFPLLCIAAQYPAGQWIKDRNSPAKSGNHSSANKIWMQA